MKFSLRRWGPGKLLLAWGAYWLALAAATVTPALALVARLTDTGAHGNASVSVDSGLLSMTITNTGGASWTGAIHFSSLVFLLFGPPLLLWIAWAASRPRRDIVASSSQIGEAEALVPALRDASSDAAAIERPTASKARARRDGAP